MRRDGAEFSAYVDARWPTIVRTVLDLGVPPQAAREVATDALSRCRREWHEAERYGDIDAVVEDALHRAVRRYDGPRQAPAEAQDPGAPPAQDELDHLARQRGTRTTSRAALVLVPLLAVIAATTWWASGSPERDGLADAELTRVENPSEAVWYAAGRLHLPHVVLQVGPVEDVTTIGDGAVYVDAHGRVLSVADDGGRRLLGHQDPRVSLSASDESGWAAWIDTERGRTVVVDVATGRTVATRTGDERVLAVDGDTVYLRDGDGQLRAWRPDAGTTTRLDDQPLLDVLGRTTAVQSKPGHVEVTQSLSNTVLTFPGSGARLSDHGEYLATRAPYGQVLLFDTRSGRPVEAGLDDFATVIAATGDDRGAITYVVDTREGRRLLEDCDTRTRQCHLATHLDRTAAVPLLAR